jgi:hypothetical protein
VVGAKNHIEYMDKKGDRSLRKVIESPVRDTVRARGLAEFKAPHGFMNLFGAGELGSLAGVWKYDSSNRSAISITAGTE